MTVMYKSSRERSDADRLSRAPFASTPASSADDDDEVFLAAVSMCEMAALQRATLNSVGLIEHLEGGGGAIPSIFSRTLPTFCPGRGCTLQREL